MYSTTVLAAECPIRLELSGLNITNYNDAAILDKSNFKKTLNLLGDFNLTATQPDQAADYVIRTTSVGLGGALGGTQTILEITDSNGNQVFYDAEITSSFAISFREGKNQRSFIQRTLADLNLCPQQK